jgi:hypothetical protein
LIFSLVTLFNSYFTIKCWNHASQQPRKTENWKYI